MPAAAGCATRSPATCTPWLSLRHDHDGAADRPAALVLVERFARLMHADPPSYYRADLALSREPEQISMDLIGHATSERIEAEAAHAWVHRRHPGQHDADYVDVADAGHPQRPAGHAVVVVIGEAHGQVSAAVRGAPPGALGEVTARQVVDHVRSGVAGRRQHHLDEVLGHVVDDKISAERGAARRFL